jgi:hypothetical protein
MRLLPLALTAALLPLGARAEEPSKLDRVHIFGLRESLLVGGTAFTTPTRNARVAFGRTHLSPDVRLYSFGSRSGLHFGWDVGGRNLPGDAATARFFTASVGPRWVFAGPQRDLVPFAVVRGGPYVARTGPDGYHTVAGENVELGLAVDHALVLSGRYDRIGRVNGFDLSGYSVRLSFKVY